MMYSMDFYFCFVQTHFRGWLARKKFVSMQRRLSAVVVIQSYWRAAINRQRYLRLKAAAIVFQACWRGVIDRRRLAPLIIPS